MKTYNDLMPLLKPYEQQLLQVISYADAFGEQQCVIIFDKEPESFISAFAPIRKHLRHKKLPLPLIIDKDFVQSSLDSYPLEFLDMSSQYHNLFNREDVLAGLHFDKEDVRLQTERELKSKLLLTRMAVLDNPAHNRHISNVVHQSIRAIIPALKGILFLSGKGIPNNLPELSQSVAQTTGIDLGLLEVLINRKKLTLDELSSYLNLLRKLLATVDRKSD